MERKRSRIIDDVVKTKRQCVEESPSEHEIAVHVSCDEFQSSPGSGLEEFGKSGRIVRSRVSVSDSEPFPLSKSRQRESGAEREKRRERRYRGGARRGAEHSPDRGGGKKASRSDPYDLPGRHHHKRRGGEGEWSGSPSPSPSKPRRGKDREHHPHPHQNRPRDPTFPSQRLRREESRRGDYLSTDVESESYRSRSPRPSSQPSSLDGRYSRSPRPIGQRTRHSRSPMPTSRGERERERERHHHLRYEAEARRGGKERRDSPPPRPRGDRHHHHHHERTRQRDGDDGRRRRGREEEEEGEGEEERFRTGGSDREEIEFLIKDLEDDKSSVSVSSESSGSRSSAAKESGEASHSSSESNSELEYALSPRNKEGNRETDEEDASTSDDAASQRGGADDDGGGHRPARKEGYSGYGEEFARSDISSEEEEGEEGEEGEGEGEGEREERELGGGEEEDMEERTPSPLLPKYLPAIHGCRSVENYEWLNRIEEGTYGVVYRARDKRTDEVVALKKLKMEREKEGFPITSLREINMLLKASHPNVVHVREIVVGSNMDKIYIVMDYVEHDLKALMETMKQPFVAGEVKTLMIQLLRAVHHLHDNWILHRDLKASNLLLSHKGILKVGDFGLAREYGSPLKRYTPVVVTLWYRAPELLLGAKEYSTAIDLWSVGCIFAELLLHKPLFPGESEIDQLNKIFKELGTPSEEIWQGYSKLPIPKDVTFKNQPYNHLRKKFPYLTAHGFDLMNRFLTYDPKKRITAEKALEHDYFKESPLPVSPSMFPTWPAKSEMAKKPAERKRSPTAPEGGAFLLSSQGEEEEDGGFRMTLAQHGKAAVGSGFSLKF